MTALTDATFYAPLKTTLVPTNGSGNPTATRTSTKTVEDNEGNVKTLKSGAVALAGARVVQNVITFSEDFTNAAWLKGGTATASAANTLNFPASGDSLYFSHATADQAGIGETWTGSVYLSGSGTIKIEVKRGAGGTFEGATSSAITLTGTLTRYEISTTFALSGHTAVQIVIKREGTTATTVTATGVQLERTTGQAIQTAGPYVSVGVLSAPWHGLGTDGAKCFATDSSAVSIPDATMLGAQLDAASKTNSMLYCRDLTNAAWVKTNCTAAKTQTGVDGLANGCSLLTATGADATCLQTITTAATAACTGWKVKRSVGTGNIYITRDNGATYTDITSLINSGTFTLTGIENTSVLNPVVGFKIATSGDAIIVDSGRNHSGTELCEDIFTTTAAVTRAAESLTYQTASNFSDTAGTILATVKRNNWANNNGSVVGKASFGLLTSASNSGVQAADGTNTVSGAAGTPLSNRKLGMRWSGSALQAFAGKVFGTAGAYDGSFNLSTIAVMPETQGYIRDLAIFNSSLTDVEIAEMVVSGAELSGGGSTSQSLLAIAVSESSLTIAGIGGFSGVGLSFGSGLAIFEGTDLIVFESDYSDLGRTVEWSGSTAASFITGASAKSVLTSEGGVAAVFDGSAKVSSLLQSGGLGNFSGIASNYAGSVLDILFESREPTHAAYLYREPNAYLSATYTVLEITATYIVPEIVAELAVPVLSATYLVPTITATY